VLADIGSLFGDFSGCEDPIGESQVVQAAEPQEVPVLNWKLPPDELLGASELGFVSYRNAASGAVRPRPLPSRRHA
jgi:hypothetical protein